MVYVNVAVYDFIVVGFGDGVAVEGCCGVHIGRQVLEISWRAFLWCLLGFTNLVAM